MSHEKKNKGRCMEAIENDSIENRLVRKFIEMVEVDYIRCVVIPVLEAEGYESIDFHHGQNEVGKDLIFSKAEKFGKKKLAVAVVKVERLTKSASDKNGFPTVLVQIIQAQNNEVISWDGSKRFPDEGLCCTNQPQVELPQSPNGFIPYGPFAAYPVL